MTESVLPVWFTQLPLETRVVLLRDPYGALDAKVAHQVVGHIQTTYWSGQEDQPRQWRLHVGAANAISIQRVRLDTWWDSLPNNKKSGLIEHRHGPVPPEFRDSVMSLIPGGVVIGEDLAGPFTPTGTVAAYLELVAGDRGPTPTDSQPDIEETVWMISPTDDANIYVFELVLPNTGAAGQVQISDLAGGRVIFVPGPIGYLNAFRQELSAGDYEISWHWMEGQTDVRVGAGFRVPLDSPRTVVKR